MTRDEIKKFVSELVAGYDMEPEDAAALHEMGKLAALRAPAVHDCEAWRLEGLGCAVCNKRAPAVTGAAETLPRCKMRHRADGAIYICTREVDHPGEHRSGTARSWPAAPPATGAPPCIGHDPLCPCQDGDSCHYRDTADTRAMQRPDAGAPPALVALVPHTRIMQDTGGTWHRAIPWEFIERALGTPAPPAAPPAPCVGCRGRGVVGGYAPVAYGEGIVGSEVVDVPCPDCAPAAPPAVPVGEPMPAIQVGDTIVHGKHPEEPPMFMHRVSDYERRGWQGDPNVVEILRPIWRRPTGER